MYLEAFFEAVDSVFATIRNTQRGTIEVAAGVIAESLANHGALLVMDTGHMLKHEAFNRAGGLMAIAPFSYGLSVECPINQRTVERSAEEEAELESRTVALALDKSKMKRGDVLIINSNSGRTSNVVEVALQCKERGITTIALCSAAQMNGCSVAHISGKKLFDAADICIDNCGPFGDASIEVKDNEKMCPLSGLAATYVLWAIQAEAVGLLQARGVNPTIFRSVHVSGPEYIEKQREAFLKQGV
ncbi:MAG: sugar isomerase domain-containing protein [Candidatus Hydrogenedentes bacterium]|nr:sugar isomerase domain-containing protein [Candidatus Hydrogenedentota bacterium]